MPHVVWVGQDSYTFPDGMSDDEIKAALGKHLADTSQVKSETPQDFNAAHRNTQPGTAPGNIGDFVEPTVGERIKSGLAHLSTAIPAGAEQFVTQPIDYLVGDPVHHPVQSLVNAITAPAGPVAKMTTDALFGGARQPLSEAVATEAAREAGKTRAAAGVRPGAITDVGDTSSDIAGNLAGMAAAGEIAGAIQPGRAAAKPVASVVSDPTALTPPGSSAVVPETPPALAASGRNVNAPTVSPEESALAAKAGEGQAAARVAPEPPRSSIEAVWRAAQEDLKSRDAAGQRSVVGAAQAAAKLPEVLPIPDTHELVYTDPAGKQLFIEDHLDEIAQHEAEASGQVPFDNARAEAIRDGIVRQRAEFTAREQAALEAGEEGGGPRLLAEVDRDRAAWQARLRNGDDGTPALPNQPPAAEGGNGPPAGATPQAGNVPLPSESVRPGDGGAGGDVLPGNQGAPPDQGLSTEDFVNSLDEGKPSTPGLSPAQLAAQQASEANFERLVGGESEPEPTPSERLTRENAVERVADLRGTESKWPPRGPGAQVVPPEEASPPPADVTPRGPGEAPPPEGFLRKTAGFVGKVYNRAVPQIVDAIERQGPVGEYTARGMSSANRFSDQAYSQMGAALDTITKGFTDDQFNHMGDVVENWSRGDLQHNPGELARLSGNDPSVITAAQTVGKFMNQIRDWAVGRVADFIPIEDYLPHLGVKPEGVPEPVQNLLARAGHESRNLTMMRSEASVRPQGADILPAIKGYIRGATQYIGELRAFDVADRPSLDAKLSDLAARAKADGYDGDLIQRFASKAMGGGQTNDPVMGKIADAAIYFQSITKPVFAAIRHFNLIRNDLASLGVGNTLDGAISMIKQRTGLDAQGAQDIIDSGAIVRNAAEDMVHSQNQSGLVQGLRKTSNIVNTPVRIMDTLKAQVTANAAARVFPDVVSLAKGEPMSVMDRATSLDFRKGSTAQQQAAQELARIGVDATKLEPGTPAYRQAMLDYMHQTVQDLQKSTTLLGSPAWAMNPWGRMAYLFNRPGAFGTDYVLNRVLKPVASGDIGPLVRYTVGSLIAYTATEAAVKGIRGKPNQGTQMISDAMEGNLPKTGEALAYVGKAAAPHGMVEDYHVRGLKPAMNYAVAHSGAYGATVGDIDAAIEAAQKESPQPLIRQEGHARELAHLADVLAGKFNSVP